jgi:hypothetical protein
MTGIGQSGLERPTSAARSVDDLVHMARNGTIRMPRFQRGFRWGPSDVEQLFDSLLQGFPIGALLLWEREAPEAIVRFGSLRVDAPEASNAWWVVDGQQRLTTLVAALTVHEAEPIFDVYFDLKANKFERRGQRRAAPLTWLPVSRLLDTSTLLGDLMERRIEGLDDESIEVARKVAAEIGDYKIPLSIVKTDDEKVLREIFYRMNSAGHRMTASEVFRALHAALDPGETGDLQTLFDNINAMGFGALRDDTILRCVLAVRGGDVYRAFEHEFADGEDPAATFAETEKALERVFAFLRTDAAIPSSRALPYNGVLPILTRFFALNIEPHPRSRNLLRRWLWRGSMAWGRDVGALRQAVQEVTADETLSVQRLLATIGDVETPSPDLDAVQLNKAATKTNIALLSSLQPRDLRDGELVDVGELLDDEGPGALLELVESSPRLSGRILHPALDISELPALLDSTTADVLASHAITLEAADALRSGDRATFVRLRTASLIEQLSEQRRRLAEPNADDHPQLAVLAVANT